MKTTGKKVNWLVRVSALLAVSAIFTGAVMIKASAQTQFTLVRGEVSASDVKPTALDNTPQPGDVLAPVTYPEPDLSETAQTVAEPADPGEGEIPGPQPVVPVAGEDVVTDSSRAKIEIGLTYHGDVLEFFGSLGNTGADAVIVKLTSPAEKVKLNQKGRFGPLWMSVKQHEVENVPFMYKIHASQCIDSILTAEQRSELGIGFESLRKGMVIHTVKGDADPADEEIIFNGLMKIKTKQNLYKIDDKERIAIKEGALFKHYFTFPSAAKEGDYIVETYLFRVGTLVGYSTDTVNVRKVGLEAKVVRWANHYPKTYGICAVIIALSAGLLVGMIFKGGGH